MKKHKHNFESDGGQCITCRKTMIELFDEKDNKISKKRLAVLDDDDIPVVKNSTDGGFWGNNTTGHRDKE
jgi:hypothetical protein